MRAAFAKKKRLAVWASFSSPSHWSSRVWLFSKHQSLQMPQVAPTSFQAGSGLARHARLISSSALTIATSVTSKKYLTISALHGQKLLLRPLDTLKQALKLGLATLIKPAPALLLLRI